MRCAMSRLSSPHRRRPPRRGLLRHRPVLRFFVRGALSVLVAATVLHLREARSARLQDVAAGFGLPCGAERRGAAVFHRPGADC